VGRILGVDLGDVRVGLAVSDPEGTVATPLATLPAGDDVASDIARVAREHSVSRVVVGLPRTLAGREGRAAQHARRVAAALAEKGLEVDMWDERFTSAEAERAMLETGAKRRERRGAADRVAATLILQAYLDSRRQEG
jgi:putative holliday junction resolvase